MLTPLNTFLGSALIAVRQFLRIYIFNMFKSLNCDIVTNTNFNELMRCMSSDVVHRVQRSLTGFSCRTVRYTRLYGTSISTIADRHTRLEGNTEIRKAQLVVSVKQCNHIKITPFSHLNVCPRLVVTVRSRFQVHDDLSQFPSGRTLLFPSSKAQKRAGSSLPSHSPVDGRKFRDIHAQRSGQLIINYTDHQTAGPYVVENKIMTSFELLIKHRNCHLRRCRHTINMSLNWLKVGQK